MSRKINRFAIQVPAEVKLADPFASLLLCVLRSYVLILSRLRALKVWTTINTGHSAAQCPVENTFVKIGVQRPTLRGSDIVGRCKGRLEICSQTSP